MQALHSATGPTSRLGNRTSRLGRRLALSALLAAGLAAGPLVSAPALADWSVETPAVGSYGSRPAVAVDGAGNLAVAWQAAGADQGIWYAPDAAGSWPPERISSGDDWSPDLAFDGAGHAHVVFIRFGAGGGLYHATNATGSWVVSLVRADPAPWSPALRIDASDVLHVAYASEGWLPGIWYATDESSGWLATRVTTSTWHSEPSLALGPDGQPEIAFARYDAAGPGILLAVRTSGGWAVTRVTSGPPAGDGLDDYPALAIDADGYRHIAFVRYYENGEGVLSHATDESGSWRDLPVSYASVRSYGAPAIGIDGDGLPEIVAREYPYSGAWYPYPRGTLAHFSGEYWNRVELTTLDERDAAWPDLVRDGEGRLAIAFRADWHEPGIGLIRTTPEEVELVAAAETERAPSIGTDGTGTRYIAFERGAADETTGTALASDATGDWVAEKIGIADSAPDLDVAADGTLRVAIADRVYWNDGGGWEQHEFETVGVTGTALTGVSDVWAVYTNAFLRAVRFDGAWAEDEITSMTADMFHDYEPDAAAADGSTYPAVAFLRDPAFLGVADLYATRLDASGWLAPTRVDATDSWDPEIAVGVTPTWTAYIAYDRGGSTPGIYLAAGSGGGAGPWTLTRLSRSYSDIEPTLAIDSSGRLYVAWARHCSGPSPGLYLATNQTGSWSTVQLVAGCDISQPSITVGPDDTISVVFTDGVAGLTLVTDATSAAAGGTDTGTMTGPVVERAGEPGPDPIDEAAGGNDARAGWGQEGERSAGGITGSSQGPVAGPGVAR